MNTIRNIVREIIREELQKSKHGKLGSGNISLLNILSEATIDQIKSKYVGDATTTVKLKSKGSVEVPQMSEQEWNKLINAKMSLGKKQVPLKAVYLDFLVKNILANVITVRDAIEKFADKGSSTGYISYHASAQYKNKFLNMDINAYRDAKEFEKDAKSIQNVVATASEDSGGSKYLVSATDMLKLKNVGIKYLGMVAGFQAFKVPKGISMDAYPVYSEILGDCAGRDAGEYVKLCTVQGRDHFKRYTTSDDLYVFFNKKDALSPYQFHYTDAQFKDKNDTPVIS